jgi:uncharacterized protein YecE (DUF72 family)
MGGAQLIDTGVASDDSGMTMTRKPNNLPGGEPNNSQGALRNDSRSAPRTDLRIGPAGWAYKDWAGVVYPAPRPKGFHEATYLAEFFDTIEINTSFYRPLRAEHAEQWIERVAENPRFLFTAKLWQRFTHDVSPNMADEREVRLGFDVLMNEKKLGAVLVQFPFAFHRTRETVLHLSGLLRRFADYPLVVEFRHASWKVPETFDLLREYRVGFCNIDQPIIGRSLEPSAEVTSEIGYVRLHGRRYDTWFANTEARAVRLGTAKTELSADGTQPRREVHGEVRGEARGAARGEARGDFFPQNEGVAIPAFERYNYLYSEEELLPWAERVETVRSVAKSTYVVTNNHYLGKGVVNALQLISILKGVKIKVPEALRVEYPALGGIAADPPEAPTLFPLGHTEKRRRTKEDKATKYRTARPPAVPID